MSRVRKVTRECLDYAIKYGAVAAATKYNLEAKVVKRAVTLASDNNYDPDSGKRVLEQIGFSSPEEVQRALTRSMRRRDELR